ncbi:MAG TPA: YhcH/YjgK/YiaL family protein [Bacteroidales bacterium]|jgi:YhcH/YjgK/YiaL family protein|nr:YhcH/YjgK/YiaL family protein [Bacteroidales bacterium]
MTDKTRNLPMPENWSASPNDVNEFEHHYSNNRETWDKAFAWLKNADLKGISAGKYEIDGDRVFASVSEYRPKDLMDTRFEAHQKYIDIQCLVSGIERIGVAPLSRARIIEEYNGDKDIAFYEIPEAVCKYYIAAPGKYFIFFPNDAHRPGIKVEGSEEVRKVVVKIMV